MLRSSKQPSLSLCRLSSVLLFLGTSGLLASQSCATDSTSPATPTGPSPALEQVAFDALGAAKVMFQRIGRGGYLEVVYLIDAAARTSIAIDSLPSLFGPMISPTGSAIVFLAWSGALSSAYDVYAADITGKNRRRLASFPGNSEGPPSWTPDGSGVVVFLVDDYPATWAIWRTSAPAPLRTFAPDALGQYECPTLKRSLDWGPISVSPTGGVAYSCAGREIDIAEASTDPLEARYQRSSLASGIHSPIWSPNGTELAFLEVLRQSDITSPILSTSLKVLNVVDGAVRTLAVVQGSGRVLWNTANPFSVCWLPGGESLVFNAASTGVTGNEPIRANLYVVDGNGSNLRQLTTATDAFDHSVSCSP